MQECEINYTCSVNMNSTITKSFLAELVTPKSIGLGITWEA